MRKISVGQTLSGAYGFAIGNYLRILGVVWFPTVVLLAVMFWQFVPAMLTMPPPAAPADPQAALATFRAVLPFEFLSFFIAVLLAVGVTKLALGRDLKWPFFYVALDGDYWRLVLSLFLAGLIFIGALMFTGIIMAIVIGVAAAVLAGPHPDQEHIRTAAMSLGLIVAIPVYAVLLALFIKLMFLLPPIVVTEKRIGIGRNWTLTRGNFWRLAGVMIGLLVPVIVLTALQYFLLTVLGGPSLNILDAVKSPESQFAFNHRLMAVYSTYWYVLVAVGMVFSPLFYGLFLGASAFAYRELVPDAVHADTFG